MRPRARVGVVNEIIFARYYYQNKPIKIPFAKLSTYITCSPYVCSLVVY